MLLFVILTEHETFFLHSCAVEILGYRYGVYFNLYGHTLLGWPFAVEILEYRYGLKFNLYGYSKFGFT